MALSSWTAMLARNGPSVHTRICHRADEAYSGRVPFEASTAPAR